MPRTDEERAREAPMDGFDVPPTHRAAQTIHDVSKGITTYTSTVPRLGYNVTISVELADHVDPLLHEHADRMVGLLAASCRRVVGGRA